MSFLLDCQCGKQIPVTEGSAGASLKCDCGRTIEVPTLRQLRQLEQSDHSPPGHSIVDVAPADSTKSDELALTLDQSLDAIYSYVAAQMQAGVSDVEIVARFVDRGMDPEAANSIVSKIRAVRRKVFSDAGRRNMLIGGIVCIIGLAITVISFGAAANAGGGTYFIAWGAVIFGAIQFFRGLFQMSKE